MGKISEWFGFGRHKDGESLTISDNKPFNRPLHRILVNGDSQCAVNLKVLYAKHFKVVDTDPDFTITLECKDFDYPFMDVDTGSNGFRNILISEVRQLMERSFQLTLGLQISYHSCALVRYSTRDEREVEQVLYRSVLRYAKNPS